MTHPGFQGASMRALRVLEAGSSGFLKPPSSLHARETLRSASSTQTSLSLVDPPPSPATTYERENRRVMFYVNECMVIVCVCDGTWSPARGRSPRP